MRDEDAVKMIKVWELCFSIAPGIWWVIVSHSLDTACWGQTVVSDSGDPNTSSHPATSRVNQ